MGMLKKKNNWWQSTRLVPDLDKFISCANLNNFVLFFNHFFHTDQIIVCIFHIQMSEWTAPFWLAGFLQFSRVAQVFVRLSTFLSFHPFHPSIHSSINQSASIDPSIASIHPSASIYPSIASIHQSIHPSTCLHLSIYSIHPSSSIYPSIHPTEWLTPRYTTIPPTEKTVKTLQQ